MHQSVPVHERQLAGQREDDGDALGGGQPAAVAGEASERERFVSEWVSE